MVDLDIFTNMSQIDESHPFSLDGNFDLGRAKVIAEHRQWLKSIRHEKPSTKFPFRVGIYIRYFNQTRYEDYLNKHIEQFQNTMALCPNWTLVDFYIDEGSVAPHMESAPEWSRLLQDCFDGKVDLIITQKISNVSRETDEVTLCARLLASQTPPIGIYFISEDLFTLASYYMNDLHDTGFFPSEDWELLPDEPTEVRKLPND